MASKSRCASPAAAPSELTKTIDFDSSGARSKSYTIHDGRSFFGFGVTPCNTNASVRFDLQRTALRPLSKTLSLSYSPGEYAAFHGATLLVAPPLMASFISVFRRFLVIFLTVNFTATDIVLNGTTVTLDSS